MKTTKTCQYCGKELTNNRRKYCNDHCQYRYNSIKKEKESHLPPPTKRNKNYFRMATGYGREKSGATQGKRAGSMVQGAMGCLQYGFHYKMAEVNAENVRSHFTPHCGMTPLYMELGDSTRIYKEQVKQQLNIDL